MKSPALQPGFPWVRAGLSKKRGRIMRNYAVAVAALAVIGFSGAAFAEEVTTTPMGPAQMTDSELDGVTAGGHEVGVMANPRCGTVGPCIDRAGGFRRNAVGGDSLDRGGAVSGNDNAAQFAPLGLHN